MRLMGLTRLPTRFFTRFIPNAPACLISGGRIFPMSTPINHNMKLKVVTMTPEWAADLLKHNHPNNRKPKDGRINSYAREMSSGLWKLTHQALAIDEDGYLVDGQNRLNAVVLAGCEVPMTMITGVPRRAMVATDCGANRNVLDAARIAGNPLPASAYPSVARGMLVGLDANKRTIAIGNQEILNFIKCHKDALDFAFESLPRNIPNLTPAGVRSVIARAYYQRNARNRTREFCKFLVSGLILDKDKDVSVIRLRNWLLMAKGQGKKFNALEVYAKTENALTSFIAEEELERLHSTSTELFPIPDDGILWEPEPATEVA